MARPQLPRVAARAGRILHALLTLLTLLPPSAWATVPARLPGAAQAPCAAGAGDACRPAPAQAQAQEPAWLADGQALARSALGLLAGAADDGLDPAHYGLDALARRMPQIDGPDAAAQFERDLGAAMRAFVTDLHGGRIPPSRRARYGDPAPFDAARHLAAAAGEGRLAQAVRDAAPAIAPYERVRASLRHYRELARRAPGPFALPPVAASGLAPGARYDGAAQLRERLLLLGDLAPGAEASAHDADRYTEALAQALRRFQMRHGLAPDGVPGPATLEALAVPLEHRVDQLALTLERLRWLPRLPDGPAVVVNLPAYRLWAFDRGGSAAPLEMRIIVGKAAGTPTPQFLGQMRHVEFNPYWNVPRSILMGEIVPRIARDPAYLRDNDMEALGPSGTAAPASGGALLAGLRSGALRLRQRPGPRNVLGAVKFALPNPINIYLHGTATPALFGRARRDLSHGCIRVEDPVGLAHFVLDAAPAWRAGGVEAAIAGGRNLVVPLPAPVPVILFYATAMTDRHGRVLFADDIYRRDPDLIDLLKAPPRAGAHAVGLRWRPPA